MPEVLTDIQLCPFSIRAIYCTRSSCRDCDTFIDAMTLITPEAHAKREADLARLRDEERITRNFEDYWMNLNGGNE